MTGKVAFQIDFKFTVGGTLIFFYLCAIKIMRRYRIYDFLLTELSVRKAGSSKLQFQFERAAMKTQHLTNT